MYGYVRTCVESSITSGHDVDAAYQTVVVGRSVHKLSTWLLTVRLNPVVKSCDVLSVFTNLTLYVQPSSMTSHITQNINIPLPCKTVGALIGHSCLTRDNSNKTMLNSRCRSLTWKTCSKPELSSTPPDLLYLPNQYVDSSSLNASTSSLALPA